MKAIASFAMAETVVGVRPPSSADAAVVEGDHAPL
jgi:hypothetical protein